MRTLTMKGSSLVGMSLLLTGVALGQGGFTTPLLMSAVQPIEDEFGNTLEGTGSAPGDLVVTYRAVNGVIEVPSTNGTPHVDNVAVVGGTEAVGYLAPMNLSEPGVFSLAISGNERPGTGEKIFVRVFNASTITGASFYADSQLITVNNNDRFALALNSTDQPVDPGDDDSDGLNNSYEKSLGTDKANPDTDDDGMNDGDEQVAGTDATDENSIFVVSYIDSAGDDVLLTWTSVAGKTYQAQANPLLTTPGGFTDIGGQVTATSTVTQIVLPDEFLQSFHNYRVEVLP